MAKGSSNTRAATLVAKCLAMQDRQQSNISRSVLPPRLAEKVDSLRCDIYLARERGDAQDEARLLIAFRNLIDS